MSEEISKTEEDSDVADEDEEDSDTESDSTEYYDYDYTSVLEENTAEDGEPETIVDANPNVEAASQSVSVRTNYLFYIFISSVSIVVLW